MTARIVTVAEAVKTKLATEFPSLVVRRSYRADIDATDADLGDTSQPATITVVILTNSFRSERRTQLDQEIQLMIVLKKALVSEVPTASDPLGEGWNDQIDPLVETMERILEIFTGVGMSVSIGNDSVDVRLLEATHNESVPVFDVEELIERSRFVGACNLIASYQVDRDPFRPAG